MEGMTATHLALLRGINVGGNALIRMAELRAALEADGFADVRTYIASGNVLLAAPGAGEDEIAARVERVIAAAFGLEVEVAARTAERWRTAIGAAPDWWGADASWKHNALVLLGDAAAGEVVEQIGELKRDLERLAAGDGVVFHSVSVAGFGRARTGKLASMPVYRAMTVRNHRTALKLAELLASG
jgi:uncharacterized protein (DUF1697 family)